MPISQARIICRRHCIHDHAKLNVCEYASQSKSSGAAVVRRLSRRCAQDAHQDLIIQINSAPTAWNHRNATTEILPAHNPKLHTP